MTNERSLNRPKTIWLSKNQCTIVDAIDFDYLCQFDWKVDWEGFAYACIHRRSQSVQRVVAKRMGFNRPTRVEHIDGNQLNNSRMNLRITK